MCFPVNFEKFLRTPFFTEHLWWLLLQHIWWEIYISMYPIRPVTNQLYHKMRKYFNTIGKKYYWCGNKHWGYGFGEWRFFWWRSMSMHVHLRILRIYFLWYQENSHPENFHQSNFPLVNSPLENSSLEYFHPCF